MTENPFESAFGGGAGGGFDLGAMLEQAQHMQQQLLAAQEELAATTVEGNSGGVTVTVNGTGEVAGVAFASGVAGSGDDEALADLGDLVVAAYRDAKVRSDALAQEKLGPLAGGMGGLPGGPGV